jgi:hypothetical protein
MSWEEVFMSWGAPPSTTEQQKMGNAETAIRKAIEAHEQLAAMDISIIPQGSYRSKTNVRQDSDVDICVCLNSTFFSHYPQGRTRKYYGNTEASISYHEFIKLLHQALISRFGNEYITPGTKAITIDSNSYRIHADVVPAFAYRYYNGENQDSFIIPTGIAFDTTDDKRIVNWPEQVYENGLQKHKNTGQRYRKMVRIVKRLRNRLQELNNPAAADIGSFLIECMVWNVPDMGFNHETYKEDVQYILATCFNNLLPAGRHATLREVNNMKLIFGTHQFCTVERAKSFFSAAWDLVGFK